MQNSPAFYTTQYASAVMLLSQQMETKVAQFFTQGTGEGKSATVVDQMDAIEADERVTRLDAITPKDPAMTRPWIYPRTFDAAVMFDTFDKMRMNADPTSAATQNIVAALNRKQDDEAIAAFFRDRQLGENAGTTESFSASYQVSVNTGGTASGMNVEKLQNAIQIFEENEIDLDQEQLHLALSPKQARNLGNEIEVISSDFYGGYMRTRKLDGFLTLRYHLTNRLPVNGSSYRRCPMWTQKGMAVFTWPAATLTKVSQRDDIRGQPWQAYQQGAWGAVRVDQKRVVEIPCAES
jgi:hypothetical protein